MRIITPIFGIAVGSIPTTRRQFLQRRRERMWIGPTIHGIAARLVCHGSGAPTSEVTLRLLSRSMLPTLICTAAAQLSLSPRIAAVNLPATANEKAWRKAAKVSKLNA